MPEGDTIHRSAARLGAVLAGRELVRFEAHRTPRPWPQPGTLVTGVEARGKHLLVTSTNGWTLQTHMRMTGSWHLYRPGERWRKPPHLGVGNVHRSEVPFALGIHPLTPIGALDQARRRAVVATAARQLRANLTTTAGTTMAGPPGTLGVYGRRGEPCRRCGTPIAWARTGPHSRGTYWCPTGQPG